MNIDTSEVLEAAGTKWNFMKFQPGLVGGHCIGVDPYYITHKAEQLGYKPQVILAGRQINDNMSRYVARYVIKMLLKNNLSVSRFTVGILGVTFKENCPDIRNSKVFGIIKELEDWGVVVKASDPLANRDATLKEYGVNLVDIQELHSLNALVVAVPHDEYKSYDLQLLKDLYLTKPRIIADLKSIYDKNKLLAEEFQIFRL
jgi:UDP-N-acetyl-D-galactosamine dehydrogenase